MLVNLQIHYIAEGENGYPSISTRLPGSLWLHCFENRWKSCLEAVGLVHHNASSSLIAASRSWRRVVAKVVSRASN